MFNEIELLTLKSEPLEKQIQTIKSLLERYPHLGDRVRVLIEEQSRSSLFEVKVTQDSAKVTKVALLAIIQADILTIPDQIARKPYQRVFEKLCEYFGVDLKDISKMSDFISEIENMLIADQ